MLLAKEQEKDIKNLAGEQDNLETWLEEQVTTSILLLGKQDNLEKRLEEQVTRLIHMLGGSTAQLI